MDNKGFGITAILAFAICSFLAVFACYSFIQQVYGMFRVDNHVRNYTNEYSKYFKSAISNDDSLLSSNDTVSTNTVYRSYDDIEASVILSTQRYVSTYYTNLFENDPLYIRISTLQVNGFIGEINDINNSLTACTGYTKVVKKSNTINYTAYINCGDNYITEGYISRLDG